LKKFNILSIIINKVKLKLSLCRYEGGVEVYLHLFLILALDVPVASPPGKCPPLNWRLGGPQRWCRHLGEAKNVRAQPGIKPQNVQPIALLT
jgi:hypothetical protein